MALDSFGILSYYRTVSDIIRAVDCGCCAQLLTRYIRTRKAQCTCVYKSLHSGLCVYPIPFLCTDKNHEHCVVYTFEINDNTQHMQHNSQQQLKKLCTSG